MSNSVSRVITAKDYARREGVGSVLARIEKLAAGIKRRGGAQVRLAAGEATGFAVLARIEFGQWLARCDECGGAEMVDPDEPIYFCFGCGNRANNGRLRPVVFPAAAERAEIERLVLERPVDDRRGLDDLDRAFQAKPLLFAQVGEALLPLSRSWEPGESVEELERQNEAVRAWRASLAGGVE